MTFLWPTSQLGMLHPNAGIPEARDRAKEFRKLCKHSFDGTSYRDTKPKFTNLSKNAVETRVAALAEFGLLYSQGPDVPLVVTPVGKQLFSLIEEGSNDATASRQATALLTWALSNCQVNRPVSPGSPSIDAADRQGCDVRPYLTAWSVMLDLGGEMFIHEFLGPVRRLQKIADYDGCVAQIRSARLQGTVFPNPQGAGNPSIYWRSHLSVAGKLLEFDNATQRLRFAPGGAEIVEAVLEEHGGSDSSTLSALRSKPYGSIDAYFSITGRPCSAEVTGAVIDALTPIPIVSPTTAPAPTGSPAPNPAMSSAEGKKRYRMQLQTERRSWVSREAKRSNAAQHQGKVTCEACGFEHPDTAMLDAHHKDPISGGIRETRVEDLLILCPTCHRRAHRSTDRFQPFTLAELQAWVQQGRP